MIMGAALLLGALVLFLHNRWEDLNAQRQINQVMPMLVEYIPQQVPGGTRPSAGKKPGATVVRPPEETPEPEDTRMTEVEIDGYGYIGYLSIPELALELPVMGQWDYQRLKTAPCRYSGTLLGEDLVILAHNYTRHFGTLEQLRPGDSVYFTDMQGQVYHYQVVGRDVLSPIAVEEVTAGVFPLTLFTCTYGGSNRVAVYCDWAPD